MVSLGTPQYSDASLIISSKSQSREEKIQDGKVFNRSKEIFFVVYFVCPLMVDNRRGRGEGTIIIVTMLSTAASSSGRGWPTGHNP